MRGEIEPVIHLKYIIMRIFNDIICITALPWQHEFKILVHFAFKMHVTRLMLNLCSSIRIREFCILCPNTQEYGKSCEMHYIACLA